MATLTCTYPNCPTTFSSTAAQQRHIRTVHEDRSSISCPHCTRRFRDRFNLRIHLRTHPGVDPDDFAAGPSAYALVSALPDLQNAPDRTQEEVVDQELPDRGEARYVEERRTPELLCHLCETAMKAREFYTHMKWHAEDLEKESRKLVDTLEAYQKCCAAAEYVLRDTS